jgi:hypothetical protein
VVCSGALGTSLWYGDTATQPGGVPVNMTMTVTSGAVATSEAGDAAMTALAERRRRRREALTYRSRWTENAHRSNEALWPDSVANPDRVRIR